MASRKKPSPRPRARNRRAAAQTVPEIPTYVIGYPEAARCAEAIEARFGVKPVETWAPNGGYIRAAQVTPRAAPPGPFIAINGSGNYHHETVPVLEGALEHEREPITYIQIDAHPDTAPRYRWALSCNTFVGRIMCDPRVESVNLMGLNPACIKPKDYPTVYTDKLDYFGCDYFAKLRQVNDQPTKLTEVFYPFRDEHYEAARQNPAAAKVRRTRRKVPGSGQLDRTLVVQWHTVDSFDLELFSGARVYLSVDLDVAERRPVTDWRRGDLEAPNDGTMAWPRLIELIDQIGARSDVFAADFCGLLEAYGSLSAAQLDDSLDAICEVYASLCRALAA